MKKIFFLITIIVALVSCGNQSDYKISVVFPDKSTEGLTAYLTNYDSGDTIDSVKVVNNCLTFVGKVDSSYMARLLVADSRLGFVVEGGAISIVWKNHCATGTPLNEKLNVINENVDTLDDADAIPVFFKAYEENKDNGIGPWAFNYYLMCNSFNSVQLDSVLKKAPAHYRDFKRIQKAINAAKQQDLTAVGKKFTDFSNANGEKLSDYVGKGQYTLVDFWASWCGPCRREIDNIKKLYEKYNTKMTFVGIAVWDNDVDTQKAIADKQIPWKVIMNGKNWTEPTDIYGISGIPHIILFDPQGNIVARNLTGDALSTEVANHIK